MSNFLAIATVTAALSQNLDTAVGIDVPGAGSSTDRPDALGNGNEPTKGVNIFLYQATANTAWRNADLPTRSADGSLLQRPQVALDLHYLLTFYGSERQLVPQRIMGSAVRTLHARPVLTRQGIRDAVARNNFLAGSELAEEVELVKFTPIPLSLEELSKLWSVFFQTPYTLSTAYKATVVLIEGKAPPQPALPVRARNLYVFPFQQPVVEQVMAQEGRAHPIFADSTLQVFGRHLLGEVTRVRVGGHELDAQEISNTRITLSLAGLTVQAGVNGLQVIHERMMGDPPTAHPGVESNVAPFVLHPVVGDVRATTADAEGNETDSVHVAVSVNPPVGKQQRVSLLLNELVGQGTYSFPAPPRQMDVTDTVSVPVAPAQPGEYLVRVQVDGADSLLTAAEAAAQPTGFDNPVVTIPALMTAAIDLTSRRRQQRRYTVTGEVTVTDQDAAPVPAAQVAVTWSLPDGSTEAQTLPTGNDGKAEFQTTGGSGTYTLTITDITMVGLLLNRVGSELEQSRDT